MKIYASLTLLFLAALPLRAQLQLEHVWDNALELEWLDTDHWYGTFALDNRAFVDQVLDLSERDREDTRLDFSFIEVTQDLGYRFTEPLSAGLEVRFRYESLFDASESNEIRLTPFFTWEREQRGRDLESDVRLEVRNYSDATAYRLKLEHGVERPFDLDTERENPVGYYWAHLFAPQWEAGKRPEYELRNEAGVFVPVFGKVTLEGGLQLRTEYDFSDWSMALFYRTKLVVAL